MCLSRGLGVIIDEPGEDVAKKEDLTFKFPAGGIAAFLAGSVLLIRRKLVSWLRKLG